MTINTILGLALIVCAAYLFLHGLNRLPRYRKNNSGIFNWEKPS